MSGSRIRVCHLGKYYPPAPGGIETHVQTLARAQAALGADVRVACVNHQNAKGNDITWSRRGVTESKTDFDQGVRVDRLGRSAHFAKLDIVPDLRRFFRQLKSERAVDVIHLHTPNPTMLLAVAALRPWAPLVITHHSDVVKQRFLYQAFSPFEQIVYRRAERIISNSPSYIDGSSLLQGHRIKTEMVPMGLDLRPYLTPSALATETARNLKKEHGDVLWLAVGRCVYYKGYDTALHALREVPGKLIIVGDGPYKHHLMQRARALGVADRIVWWSYASSEALAGAYQAATAFWFPSNARSEAFGLVQIEAMASGCPVINTSIPHSGVSWVSQDGRTGLTVAVNDPRAFAAAAKRLLADAVLRDRLATNARRHAVDHFDESAMASRTLAVYQSVIDRRLDSVRRPWKKSSPRESIEQTTLPEPSCPDLPSPTVKAASRNRRRYQAVSI